METIKAIRSRRSIRKFKDKKIEDKVLWQILDAARWAPSSGNLQPTRIIVVEDEKKKKVIARAALGQDWIVTAPAVLIVCSLTKKVEEFYGKRGKEIYAIQNIAAAIENILVAAADLGIGTAWVAAYTEPALRKEFKIPKDIEIHAIIPLGYPDESPRAPPRLELADILHFDEWGKQQRGEEFWPLERHIPKVKKAVEKALKEAKKRIKKKK